MAVFPTINGRASEAKAFRSLLVFSMQRLQPPCHTHISCILTPHAFWGQWGLAP